jgi:hypothetical protein
MASITVKSGTTAVQETTNAIAKPPVVENMPLPAELSSDQYTFTSSSSDTASEAAQAFSRTGLVKIKGLVSRELSLQALEIAQASLKELFAEMEDRNVVLEQGTKGGFAEIVQRSEGRYEMNYKMTEGIFAHSEFTKNSWLKEFVDIIMEGTETEGAWELNRRSLLISFPGAKGQQWHVDGDHLTTSYHSSAHAINAFIALGDITLDMGPTELRPASHFLSRKLFKFMMLARARKQLHSPVRPVASSGDAVIFDYRTLHRGTANDSERPRAMLELVFFKKGYADLLNFPKRSIFDVMVKSGGSTTSNGGGSTTSNGGGIMKNTDKSDTDSGGL